MSYTKQNIEKYQRREAIELWKAFGYHCAEFLTAVGIFVFAAAIIIIL
jgi:hypothetical protein